MHGPLWLFGSNDLFGLRRVVQQWATRALAPATDPPGADDWMQRVVIITGGVGAATPPLLDALLCAPSPLAPLNLLEFKHVAAALAAAPRAARVPKDPRRKRRPTAADTAAIIGCTDASAVQEFVSEADVFLELLLAEMHAAAPTTQVLFVTHADMGAHHDSSGATPTGAGAGAGTVASCAPSAAAQLQHNAATVLVVFDDASTHTGQNAEYGAKLIAAAGLDVPKCVGSATAFQRPALLRRTIRTVAHETGASPTPVGFPASWAAAHGAGQQVAAALVVDVWAELLKLHDYRDDTPDGHGFITLTDAERRDEALAAVWTGAATPGVTEAVRAWAGAVDGASHTAVQRTEQLPVDDRWQ